MISEKTLIEIEKTQSMCLSDMKDVVPTVRTLQAEIDHLNRIMPHINITCKYAKNLEDSGKSVCNIDYDKCRDECWTDDGECINNKWELKE